MPTPTYTPLANVTLGSSAATVTFSSISQSYKDLVLIIENAKTVSGTMNLNLRFNNVSTSTYSTINIWGNGASIGSTDLTGRTEANLSGATDFLTNDSVWAGAANIMNYSATNTHTSIVSRGNRSENGVSASVNRWADTAAITSITLAPEFFGSFAAGTTMALYGVIS